MMAKTPKPYSATPMPRCIAPRNSAAIGPIPQDRKGQIEPRTLWEAANTEAGSENESASNACPFRERANSMPYGLCNFLLVLDAKQLLTLTSELHPPQASLHRRLARSYA